MFCSGRTIAVGAAGIDAKRPRSVEADAGGEVMTVRSSNPGESGRNADSNLNYRCSASPGCRASAFGDDELLLNRHDHCGAEYLKDHVLASMAADQHTRTPNTGWFSVCRQDCVA